MSAECRRKVEIEMSNPAVRFAWCLLACVVALVSGCGPVASGHAVAGTERSECDRVEAPLWSVPVLVKGMPRVAVPMPTGWSTGADKWRVTPAEPPVGAGLMISNSSLAVAGHVPSVLVDVYSFPPDAFGSGDAEQRALDELIADIGHSGRIVTQKSRQVCGHPSVDVQYVREGWEASALIVAAQADDGRVWRVWLNFLSRNPRNPQWIKDTQTIRDGLVVKETPRS